MDALEILKELRDITCKSKECFGYEANFRFNSAYITRLESAIKELTALNNKTCEGCTSFVNGSCDDYKGHYCIRNTFMEDRYCSNDN